MGKVIDLITAIGYAHNRAANAEWILDDHVAEPALTTQRDDR
jgi:hypothetical protein